MARKKSSPSNTAYYEALQEVFKLQSGVLTAVIPHAGERGANDEERCREFLRTILPSRYSVGSGFVHSADPPLDQRTGKPVDATSPQQDVVIYDDLNNSPLHRELAAAVYPVEIVYATVEVKGWLTAGEIKRTVQAIARTRRLGMRCHYLEPGPPTPGRWRRQPLEPVKKPPWAFVFIYDTSYRSLKRFQNAWQAASDKLGGAHVHGIVVLKRDWYAFQLPNTSPSQFKTFEGNALLQFVNSMLTLLRAAIILEADISLSENTYASLAGDRRRGCKDAEAFPDRLNAERSC